MNRKRRIRLVALRGQSDKGREKESSLNEVGQY